MKYNFYVSSMGGSLGWIRWRNTIPDSVLPAWMSRYGTSWGTLYWGNPVSEEAFQDFRGNGTLWRPRFRRQ